MGKVSMVLHASFCCASAVYTMTNPTPSATFYFALGCLGLEFGIGWGFVSSLERQSSRMYRLDSFLSPASPVSLRVSLVRVSPVGAVVSSVPITGTSRGRGSDVSIDVSAVP